jgi:hypothetical protein
VRAPQVPTQGQAVLYRNYLSNLFAARCATGPLVIAGLAAMRRQLTAPLSAACPGGYSTRLLADADLKAVELGRLRR